jgi:hypothetical protein
MGHSQCASSFTFADPGYYRIVVQGRLDPNDADCLGGMAITMASAEQPSPVATLVGRLKDQAQLSGILNTLYQMHLTILTVQALGDGADQDKKENEQ